MGPHGVAGMIPADAFSARPPESTMFGFQGSGLRDTKRGDGFPSPRVDPSHSAYSISRSGYRSVFPPVSSKPDLIMARIEGLSSLRGSCARGRISAPLRWESVRQESVFADAGEKGERHPRVESFDTKPPVLPSETCPTWLSRDNSIAIASTLWTALWT